MRIRYILGRAGRGKTNFIYKNIKEKIEDARGNKQILIVPEQFTLQTEVDLIDYLDMPGIINVEVLSFQRLAHKVFREVGGIKGISINELGKVMMLRKIFDEVHESLKVFQNASRREGFLTDFNELITEFKRNDVSPEILKESIESLEENSQLRRKLEDILLVYDRLNEYMVDKYTDEEDKFNLLIDLLERAKFLEGAEIWIDGFVGFTEQEYRIIEKLLIKCEKLNIALTLYDLTEKVRDTDLFEPTHTTFKRLREVAAKLGAKETKTLLKDAPKVRHRELEHLEGEIFSYPLKEYKEEPEAIEVFSAMNQYTEIERVASKIISLVRDKGYRWKDIALVNNSMESYGQTIKRVFNEYGIPYFIDEKRDILNNTIIRFILSSIDILVYDFRYEDVFKYIKTGLSGIDKKYWEILENYVLEHGIRGKKWFEEFKWGENPEKINEIREKFVEPFKSLKESLKGSNTIRDICKIIFSFLESMAIEEKLHLWISELKKEGHIEYANENSQIWNIVIEVFDQLVEILGDTKITLKEFSKILEAGFSEYKIGVIPPTVDQVLVGSLERSKSHDIKALFLVGVNDGILPSGFKDEGLILDEEKMLIRELGVPISSDSFTRINNERFSIYTAISKPKEYLWLSYSLSDMEGKALRPSILIDRIKRIYPKIRIKSDIGKVNEIGDVNEKLMYISRPLPTFKYLVENLRQMADGYNMDSLWEEVYKWYYHDENWKSKIMRIVEGLFHNNQPQNIGEDKAAKLYSIPLKSNISRLEKYSSCPFSHFITYGLRPAHRKEYKIDFPDLGIIFHNSLEAFSKELVLQGLNWKEIDQGKCGEIVDKIVDELTEKYNSEIFQNSFQNKYMINRIKRVSRRAVWTLTQHLKRGDFEPAFFELSFGTSPKDDLPPIIIELPEDKKVYLEGRIDRVDFLKKENGTYVRIIDYKTGAKDFKLSDVYYGIQLQLLLYLTSILENKDKLNLENVYPGGVFYFKLKDPMVEAASMDSEDVEKKKMKELRMDGFVIKDMDVVKGMDRNIDVEKSSIVIPVSLKKDGDFSKSSSLIKEEDINILLEYVKSMITKIAYEIFKGNIRIEPYKKRDTTPCNYCDFHSICQFDRNFQDNKYRVLNVLPDEEVLEKVKKEKGGEENAPVD